MEAGAIRRSSPSGWAQGLAVRVRAARIPLALVSVLLVAAVLRGWDLGAKSLWFDETYSVFLAQQPLIDLPRLLQTYDTHPPLYYGLLHVWIALFGSSEVAVRLPSVLASLGAVAVTFLLGRRLAGDRVGILAAALLALSPFQVTAAQEARMYPFLTLFGAGASYALWLAVEEGRRRHWITYVVLMVLALSIHHFAFLLLLAQGVYILAVQRTRTATRLWLLCAAVMAIVYLPLLPVLFAQVTTARAWPNFRPPFGVGAITDMMGLFGFGGGLFGMGTYFRRGGLPIEYRAAVLLPFALLVLAGVGALDGWRKRGYILGYWLLPVLAIAVVSLRWNMFYERYFSFVLPPFFILLAGGVFYVADAMRGQARAVATVCLLLLLASFNLPALANVYRDTSSYDWRSAARHVTAKAKPTDFILFIPAFARIPFMYYYRGPQVEGSLNPTLVRRDPQKVQLADADAKRLVAIARDHPRMWIIATIPIGYEARKEIAKILAPAFREVDGRSFGLVYAFLWESRLHAGPGRR